MSKTHRKTLALLAALLYGGLLVGIAWGPWWFWKWVIVALCFGVSMGLVGLGIYILLGLREGRRT